MYVQFSLQMLQRLLEDYEDMFCPTIVTELVSPLQAETLEQ